MDTMCILLKLDKTLYITYVKTHNHSYWFYIYIWSIIVDVWSVTGVGKGIIWAKLCSAILFISSWQCRSLSYKANSTLKSPTIWIILFLCFFSSIWRWHSRCFINLARLDEGDLYTLPTIICFKLSVLLLLF